MRARQRIDQVLVADVAYEMLQRAAAVEPARAAEQRVFDTVRAAYFADPRRALAGVDGGGQLAFGLPGVEELLTPVLIAAAAEVVAYLTERAAAASDRGIRRVLGLSAGPESPPAREDEPDDLAVPKLTDEQWAHVRDIVTRTLVRHSKMSSQRADLIAAAVVGDGMTGHEQR